ncbi:MAG TPA: hypothetical protein VG755_11435 [Nannocystaceae bacterium]|nr:hypothetical protein [Nannocystaceae bacterium]
MLHGRVVLAHAAALVAIAASAAAIASLWPALFFPGWPAASLGLAALAMAAQRGPIRPRAAATVMGCGAALTGGAQLALLWAAAVMVPGG